MSLLVAGITQAIGNLWNIEHDKDLSMDNCQILLSLNYLHIQIQTSHDIFLYSQMSNFLFSSIFTYFNGKHEMNYSKLFQNFHIHSAGYSHRTNTLTSEPPTIYHYMVKHHSYILHVCTSYMVIIKQHSMERCNT